MGEKYTFTVSGDKLLEKIKELVREGNVRRIRLIHEDKALIDIPLTVGASAVVITVLALPVLAAIGAFAALLTNCTIEVEKMD